MVDLKACTKCLRVLPAKNFYRRKDRNGALTPSCKTCQGAKNRVWAKANPERMKELKRPLLSETITFANYVEKQ